MYTLSNSIVEHNGQYLKSAFLITERDSHRLFECHVEQTGLITAEGHRLWIPVLPLRILFFFSSHKSEHAQTYDDLVRLFCLLKVMLYCFVRFYSFYLNEN